MQGFPERGVFVYATITGVITLLICYIMNMNILKKIGDMGATVRRGIVGAVEAVNPYDAESRGNTLINQTASKYKTTPEFKNILDRTNPYVGGASRRSGQMSAQASYAPKKDFYRDNSRMWVGDGSDDPQGSMLHEGLHAAWDEGTPELRSTYMDILERSLPPANHNLEAQKNGPALPDARTWLAQRTRDYQSPMTRPLPYNQLPNNVQTEIHSYIPSYYKQSSQPMPDALRRYYSSYYSQTD